jgi:anti-anti-sigma factor
MTDAKVEVSAEDRSMRISLSGEIDLANAAAVEDEIREAVSNQPAIVSVDLTDLTYMDSAGVKILFTRHLGYRRCGSRWNSSYRPAVPPAGSSSYRGSSRSLRSNQRTPDRSSPRRSRSPKRPVSFRAYADRGSGVYEGDSGTGTELPASRVISIYPYLHATRRRR